MSELRPNSDPIEHPVFVVGAERSGSTMFWLMLDSHPGIAVSGEMQYITTGLPPDRWPTTEEFLDHVHHDLEFQTSGFEVDGSLEYPDLARSFFAQRLAESNETVAAAVVHHKYSQLPRLWPEARYIHLVRDGRDVATSVMNMGWSGTRYAGANSWVRALDEWDRLSPLIDEENIFTLRYEELVTNPRSSLAEVCDFIGVGYDEAMFDYVEKTEYGFPDSSYASQWRKKELDRDAELVEHKIFDRLSEYGYEAAFSDPRPPSSAELAKLSLRNKRGRVQYRVDQVGMRKVAIELVTRPSGVTKVPGMAGLRRRAKDSILEAHIAARKRHWDPNGSELLR